MKHNRAKKKKFFTLPIQIIAVGIGLSAYGVVGGMIISDCEFADLIWINCVNEFGHRLDDHVIAGYAIAAAGMVLQLLSILAGVYLRVVEKRQKNEENV